MAANEIHRGSSETHFGLSGCCAPDANVNILQRSIKSLTLNIMPSLFTHAAVPIALYSVFPRNSIAAPVVLAATISSVAPDLDVVGFDLGIEYGAMLGHRGVTHSIAFAVVIAALLTIFMPRGGKHSGLPIFLFLFASTVSHGILDSMTNGGLGVAFLAPFYSGRYFFRWRPIEVSPLWTDFFSARGAQVFISELKWVWCPLAGVITIGQLWPTRPRHLLLHGHERPGP